MPSMTALILLATTGCIGCVTSACLVLWSTYQQARIRMSQWQQESPVAHDPATDNAFRKIQHELLQRYQWIMLLYATCLLILIALMVVLGTTVKEVKSLALFLLVISGVYLVLLLVTLLYCNRYLQQQQPRISNKPYTTSEDAYRMTRTIGFVHAFVATLAWSWYAIATLQGNNPAFDETSFYHGPAPILSYQGQNVNYNNVARKATLEVGYATAWACPNAVIDNNNNNNNNVWCQDEVELFWCDVYDKTGYWSGDESLEPTWRYWQGQDLWWRESSSSFSCAKGMNSNNGNDQVNDDDDQNNNQDKDYQQYLDSPFDAPYLINVFANCDGRCQVVVDDPFFREKFFHISSLKHLMLTSSMASLVFLCLAGFFFNHSQKLQKSESSSLQATASVELLPSVHTTTTMVDASQLPRQSEIT